MLVVIHHPSKHEAHMNETIKDELKDELEDEYIKQITSEEEEDGDNGDDELEMKDIGTKVWLVKLPRFLLDKWQKTEGDKDLGFLRLKDRGRQDEIKLVLPDTAENANIPKEYDLSVTNTVVKNTFVFQEEQRPSKRSRTSLKGTVAHECSVRPIPSESYSQIMKQRSAKASQPKREIRRLDDSSTSFGGNLLAPGTTGFQSNNVFIESKKTDKRPELKATRLPRNEVMDMLFRCFESYDYWTLKGLREATGQPEAWLKEILETMAVLNKKGPYALKWSLKREYRDYRNTLANSANEKEIDKRE